MPKRLFMDNGFFGIIGDCRHRLRNAGLQFLRSPLATAATATAAATAPATTTTRVFIVTFDRYDGLFHAEHRLGDLLARMLLTPARLAYRRAPIIGARLLRPALAPLTATTLFAARQITAHRTTTITAVVTPFPGIRHGRSLAATTITAARSIVTRRTALAARRYGFLRAPFATAAGSPSSLAATSLATAPFSATRVVVRTAATRFAATGLGTTFIPTTRPIVTTPPATSAPVPIAFTPFARRAFLGLADGAARSRGDAHAIRTGAEAEKSSGTLFNHGDHGLGARQSQRLQALLDRVFQ